MDFEVLHQGLLAIGYSDDTADAKIAHDIVLKAICDAGFHDHLTIKGGVVMSGLTNVVRRATMDMDVDFLHYSLANESIRKFVSRLSRVAPCRISIKGRIVLLKQQEYKGKRIFLTLTDAAKHVIETKIDVGVHTREEVVQGDLEFKLSSGGEPVTLLVNSKEQIFVEKLKSLLRFGGASTRYKDVYDMYYLSSSVRSRTLLDYIRLYVFQDAKMREKTNDDICRRLTRIFSNADYMKGLSNPACAWMDVDPVTATKGIVDSIKRLEIAASL